MKIVITGGGTGGHVFPAVAVGKELVKKGHEVIWIGSRNGMEKGIVKKEGFEWHGIFAGKLRRYFDLKNLVDAGKFGWGILQARGILKMIAPEVIFSKGGFVSVPVCLAAKSLGIPIVTHESDATPGLATKLIVRFGGEVKICAGFESVAKFFPKHEVKVTGTPVGEHFFKTGQKRDGERFVGVVGGSQGAVGMNRLVWEALPELLKKTRVVHQTGEVSEGEAETVSKVLPEKLREKYLAVSKVSNEEMAEILAQSDVVISRAGATFLAEAAAVGCCVILVPLPKSGSRGDQIDNAEFLQENGAAEMVRQGEGDLEEVVMGLLGDEGRRGEMGRKLGRMAKPKAVREIVRVIEGVV